MLVSKNVNTNLVQGLAITLEQYIAAYAVNDFFGKSKEFNKYYNYKMKGGKIYAESDANWFDLDPLTQSILDEAGPNAGPYMNLWNKSPKSRKGYKKKNVKSPTSTKSDPTKQFQKDDPMAKSLDFAQKGLQLGQDVNKALKDLKANKDPEKGNKPIDKPQFKSATLTNASINLEPTWVTVHTTDGSERRLGIKVIPMMIEGFNIKHTISQDMGKYFMNTFTAAIGRKVMRLLYRMIDRWTAFGNRPRGDIRQDMFYARTGHDGQPFVLLDKNDDIPKLFFAQPQNMLKLWKLSWGNLIIADDLQKTVMFCMKKYKGMCSTFTYSMIYAQTKEMARVFEDMEDARKATSSLIRFNKKITSLGGK